MSAPIELAPTPTPQVMEQEVSSWLAEDNARLSDPNYTRQLDEKTDALLMAGTAPIRVDLKGAPDLPRYTMSNIMYHTKDRAIQDCRNRIPASNHSLETTRRVLESIIGITSISSAVADVANAGLQIISIKVFQNPSGEGFRLFFQEASNPAVRHELSVGMNGEGTVLHNVGEHRIQSASKEFELALSQHDELLFKLQRSFTHSTTKGAQVGESAKKMSQSYLNRINSDYRQEITDAQAKYGCRSLPTPPAPALAPIPEIAIERESSPVPPSAVVVGALALAIPVALIAVRMGLHRRIRSLSSV